MFEHSLIDLEEKQHPRRRWAPLPVAVGLHLVVLASVALAQVWNVGAVQEPERAMGPYQPIPVFPAPPPPAGGQTQHTATTAPTAPTPPVRQPDADRIPDTPPADPGPETPGPVIEDASPFGSQDGVAGGLPGGETGGVPNSGGGGVGFSGPIVAPEPRNEILRFDGTMTRPVMLSGRQPRYTEMARRAGTQGVVVLEAVIDKQGRVTNVRVLKQLKMGLDEEAVAAVKEWVFEPARIGKQPVAVYYTLTVNFQIQR